MARHVLSRLNSLVGKRRFAAWSTLFVLTAVAMMAVEHNRQASIQTAKRQFEEHNARTALDVKRRIEDTFHQIHRGLRMISRLPGVRTIERYGESFSADAKASAQEIYNNLAQSVALSEVYIVPIDFDPDAIDPVTGRLQEPITTFDDLIVGRTADQPELQTFRQAARLTQTASVEEIEIHEYRVMKKQIAFLKARHPTEQSASYVHYPAVGGEEVITCDNTRYSPSNPNDDDRKGLVYSVPFYSSNGNMRGVVTAVVLTAAIRDLIPGGIHAIVGVDHGFLAGSSDDGTWNTQRAHIRQATAAPDQEFSSVRALDIPDLKSKWHLWTSRPSTDFYDSPAVVAAQTNAMWQHVAILIVAALTFALTRTFVTRHVLLAKRAEELEAHVAQRTLALSRAKAEAEQANLAKSRFLANMSHEIRTPLGVMLGMSELLADSKLDKPQSEHISIVQSAGRTLSALVNSVLDISAIEAGKLQLNPKPASIARTVKDIASMFSEEAKSKGLTLEVNVAHDLEPDVLVDSARLKQVLINLIGNAIKFTEQGRVAVEACGQPSHADDKKTVTIRVSDTGIGISPEARAFIFDAFAQADEQVSTRYGGTGLGLAISHALVKAMGGTLDFEGAPGKGASFFFSFDVVPAANESTPVQQTDPQHAGAERAREVTTLRALLAEDNADMVRLTKTILENQGYRVDVARDGRDAVDLFAQTAFDIVIMDCRMPGLDGFEATRAIRDIELEKERNPVPILALTAHGFVAHKQACAEAGMTGFLSKPFTRQQLLEAIQGLVACGTRSNHGVAG